MESETQIAWAAGLFEGEGHFSMSRRHTKAYLTMGLTTTDKDVMERFSAITGMPKRPKRRRKGKPHYKDQWACGASGQRAVGIASVLAPYLGNRRTARLKDILRQVEASQPQPRFCPCCESEFTPKRYVRIQRYCSEECTYRAKYLRRVYGVSSEATAKTLGFERWTERPFNRGMCPQGHPYSGDNLYVYERPSGHRERRCRECARQRQRARRA